MNTLREEYWLVKVKTPHDLGAGQSLSVEITPRADCHARSGLSSDTRAQHLTFTRRVACPRVDNACLNLGDVLFVPKPD